MRRSKEEDLVNTSIHSNRVIKKHITLKDIVNQNKFVMNQ